MAIDVKKSIIAIACSQAIGCASLKYPNWEQVSIETSVINKPCESKNMVEEQCFNDDCNTWFKKRATIYGANTVLRHGDSASYFYCATGLVLYQNRPQRPECNPIHDKKYQRESYVNIKGYYLGMDKCEIEQSLGVPDESFTVVGITVGEPIMEFIDNKLSMFHVRLPSSKFDTLQHAIQSKFPDIECNDSIAQNRIGARFDQIECILIYKKGRLIIKKRSSSINHSSLSLISNTLVEKKIKENSVKEQDI